MATVSYGINNRAERGYRCHKTAGHELGAAVRRCAYSWCRYGRAVDESPRADLGIRDRLLSALVEPTIYEVMGGAEALLALAEAWHKRCLADPILAHPFEGGVHPQHTERLAAYWSEQLGGPATYTESVADYSHVVRVHTGNGPHEQMDGRAVAAFVLALDDVGIPTDERLRFQLIAWFTWATAMLNHRWTSPDEVPSDLPLPGWNWEGTEGW